MGLNFLKLRWKGILVVCGLVFILSVLWVLREEIGERAAAMAELTHAVQVIDQANQTIDQLEQEREAAEEAMAKLRAEREQADQQLNDALEELNNEEHAEWRDSSLPDGLADKLHDHYGNSEGTQDGSD